MQAVMASLTSGLDYSSVYVAHFPLRPAVSSSNYDPFDTPLVGLLPYVSPALICLALLWQTIPAGHLWLPKVVLDWTRTLSPFISEEDLKAGSSRHGFLRRGAVLKQDDDPGQYSKEGFAKQTTRNTIICALSLAELVTWTAVTGWNIAIGAFAWATDSNGLHAISALFTWATVMVYILVKKPLTPPLSVLLLVLVQTASSSIRLLRFIPFMWRDEPLSELLFVQLVGDATDLVACFAISAIIFAMPVAPGGLEGQVPKRERMRLESGEAMAETEDLQRDYEMCPTTPEDYASLASTLTYTWMQSIQRLALLRPLIPSDIWRLRSINDTRVLSRKYATLAFTPDRQRRSLARRLLICNANDIALDFTYKVCGVTLAYAGPALMRAILESISDAAVMEGAAVWSLQSDGFRRPTVNRKTGEQPDWTPRSKAFVLALLALAFTLVRYVAELKNFHHARQVGLRVRSVLVVELLEKALKRRDMKGVVESVEKESDEASPEEVQETVDQVKRQTDAHDDLDHLGTDANNTAQQEGDEETQPLLANGRGASGERSDASPRRAKAALAKAGSGTESQADVGKVVNMMAEDINTLLRLGCDSHQLYGAPIEVIIATTFLYQLLGWSALAGFSLLVAALPLNYFVGRWYVKSATEWRKATDERISLVTELLMAIRFIKLQGAQDRWRDKIMKARYREMWEMIRANMKEFLMVMLWVTVPISCTLFTFFVYVTYQKQELTIPVAFTALTLFSMLRSPLDVIPSFAMSILRALVSVRRLESYLGEDEVEDCISAFKMQESDVLPSTDDDDDDTAQPLSIDAGTFTWESESQTKGGKPSFTLSNVTISFPPAGLCVIEGPTASGKSSLLAALLGEMRRTTGKQSIPKFGKRGQCLFSFAGQVAWVEAGKSVRKNILFTTPYNEERYRAVVHACALQDDFDEWEDGDETRISKQTLSGGQKARISLARALYSHSKTVFLDDVLSAVDTRVQNHIYQHGLTGPLASGRRIILVTHHVNLVLPSVKYLVRLKNGQVVASGTVEELQARGLLGDMNESGTSSSASSIHTATNSESTKLDELADKSNGHSPKAKSARLLYELESRNVGSVKWDCYSLYLSASSPFLWVLVVFFTVVSRAVAASEQYWLKLWGEASIKPSYGLPPAAGHQGFYLGMYGLIGVATILTVFFRCIVYYTASYRASKQLYSQLLYGVVRAKMRFFDRNPTGRILQRFNSDFSLVDGQ